MDHRENVIWYRKAATQDLERRGEMSVTEALYKVLDNHVEGFDINESILGVASPICGDHEDTLKNEEAA